MSKVRILCVTMYAFAAALGLHELFQFLNWAKPLTLAVVVKGGQVSAAERSLRPNYPYSVIPGGAYSGDELRKFVAKDKVIRAHYADFDVNSARVVTLASDRYQYVSYRINGKILWTHKKIRIPKGETLLTDGRNFARTRCGNRLCATLAAPATFTIPPLKALALPPFTMQLLSQSQLTLADPPDLDVDSRPGMDFGLPRLASYATPINL